MVEGLGVWFRVGCGVLGLWFRVCGLSADLRGHHGPQPCQYIRAQPERSVYPVRFRVSGLWSRVSS